MLEIKDKNRAVYANVNIMFCLTKKYFVLEVMMTEHHVGLRCTNT